MGRVVRAQRIMASVLVSVSCVLGAASCVQRADAPSGAGRASDEEPARIQTIDDGDTGCDPDLGIPGEPTGTSRARELDALREAGDGFTHRVCVLLKGGPTTARVAFCLSQPARDVRWRCFSHLEDSAVSWANWCYNEFAE